MHLAFKQLVLCLQSDLKQAMPQMLHPGDGDDIGALMQVGTFFVGTLSRVALLEIFIFFFQVLSSAMNLLRKCRVNAALTIQLFSQLFHFVNMWTFNQARFLPNQQICWAERVK